MPPLVALARPVVPADLEHGYDGPDSALQKRVDVLLTLSVVVDGTPVNPTREIVVYLPIDPAYTVRAPKFYDCFWYLGP